MALILSSAIYGAIEEYKSSRKSLENVTKNDIDLSGGIEKANYIHHIDNNVWLAENSIRWPSNEQEIHVYFSNDVSSNDCLELKQAATLFFSRKDTYGQVDYGEICNKFVVLFNEKKLENTKDFKSFFIAHESFHLAFQYYGQPMVLAAFEYDDSYFKITNFDYLLDFLSLLRKSFTTTQLSESCSPLVEYVNALSLQQRNRLLIRAMYEWPAEYYARQIVFPNEINEYIKFRKNIINIYDDKDTGAAWESFYMMSQQVVQQIETTISTYYWQQRVAKGEALLDIYLKQRGCQGLTNSWEKIYVKSKPLVTTGGNTVISPIY